MTATPNHHHGGGWAVAPVSPVHSGKQIRSNLLNKLGIMESMPSSPSHRESSRYYDKAQILQEPLKHSQPRMKGAQPGNNPLIATLACIFASNKKVKDIPELPRLDSCSDGSSFASNEDRHGVSFNEVVTVIPIPRRDQYSDRMRNLLWDSPEVMQASIVRNSLEFAADGYDPLNAREEDQHIRCPKTGKLVHPIHFELAKVLRQKRGLPEADMVENLLKTV